MSRTGSSPCTGAEENRAGQGLVFQIQAQLEELFSDSHLSEDGFLLKHIQKNKDGFVNLKFLTSLKKIKVLTDNRYMTLAAALLSSLLEVSSEFTRVRRLLPYPDWLLCSPTSKLLLFWNLPTDWLTPPRQTPQNLHPTPALHPRILARLSSYGTITAHWLLPAGQDLPKELQCYAKCQRELGQCLCAVVKFDTLAAIRKAYSELKGAEVSAGKKPNVVTLGFRSAYLIEKEQLIQSQGDGKVTLEVVLEVNKVTENVEIQEALGEGADLDSGCADVAIETCLNARDTPQVPWILRNRVAQVKNRVKVIRLPRGPDGTKGFRDRRKPYV
ncbi:la-related protein 6-like [Periophthalmus magnuspinnatus]|uniref:la-related protein 6-like n=1 Tax=Periophthalmus magnuspinnatus TaxID=409849 RepID=UPI00145AE0FA|nr:la-related protein 6-like [Periophthalmus magnuspinnatus]